MSQVFWDRQARAGTRFTVDQPGPDFLGRVEPGAAILDLGCGYGRTLELLHRRGCRRLTGVDFSGPMLSQARQRVPASRLVRGDAGALPFPNGVFDAVLALALFTCIVDDQTQRRVTAELQRVLRPGGLFYGCLFLLNRDRRNQARYREQSRRGAGSWGVFRLPGEGFLRHHALSHLRQLFRGFRELRIDECRFRTMGGHSSRGAVVTGRC